MSFLPFLLLATLAPSGRALTRLTAMHAPELQVSADQGDNAQLVGVWLRERSDSYTYQKITLVLRSDGTYTKTLVARVNGAPYGGTHDGTWTAQGSVVRLSGDGNWPAITHDLSEFQRAR